LLVCLIRTFKIRYIGSDTRVTHPYQLLGWQRLEGLFKG
jgi:hypothetical protein